MAAGRHGGYRENEFRERESSFELRQAANVNGDVDNGRGVRDLRDRIRENGGYRSSSSRSDSGGSAGRGVKLSAKAIDREPGELSSESGSDDAIESASQQVRDVEVTKVVENGTQIQKERKRKFSPIVWDRDDKEGSNSSKTRIRTALPPPPPIARVSGQSPNVSSGSRVQISSGKMEEGDNVGPSSPVKSPVAPETVSNGVYVSPVELSSPEQKLGDVREGEQIEDEDYVPTRNISSSRWAAGNNSPGEAGGVSESEDIPKRRRKMPGLGSVDNRVRNSSLTPELGEVKKDGSERSRARSSESDEREPTGRSSGDDYPDNDSERDDYMDVEKDHGTNDSVGRYDTSSEDEPDSPEAPEPAAPPQRIVNMLQGCRSVDEFERLNKIDEGTYGVVYRAQDKRTGEIVALKKVKMEKEREGFPLTSLREINILLSFHHPSIVDVKEVVVGSNLDSIFMVMEYMEHDLKALMETMRQPFSPSEVKCLMLQWWLQRCCSC